MKRPKKPKRPLKSEPEPGKMETHVRYVYERAGTHDTEYALLRPDECAPPEDLPSEEDHEEWWYDFYDKYSTVTFPVVVSALTDLQHQLPQEVGLDFTLEPVNDDGYTVCLELKYELPVPQDVYEARYKKWETRFDRYEEELKVWEAEMAKYEEYKKQQKIDKLKKEIEKLES